MVRCGFLEAVLSGETCAVVHHPALRASRGSGPDRGGPRTRADRPAPGWSKAPHSNRLGPCSPGQGRIRGGFKHNPLPSPPTEPRSKVGSNNASWLILANLGQRVRPASACMTAGLGQPAMLRSVPGCGVGGCASHGPCGASRRRQAARGGARTRAVDPVDRQASRSDSWPLESPVSPPSPACSSTPGPPRTHQALSEVCG